MMYTGAHLRFSEGRGSNLRKGQANIKRKRNECKSYIGDNFLIIRSLEATKLGTYMIVDKKFFSRK